MVTLWGFLKFLCWGCLYATSRWTLTTTLFRAIKRTNLSRGSKTCFYTFKRRLAIFMHFKTLDITRVSCVIYFLCLFYYCFCLLFSEDLTVVRIYRIKIYCQWYFLAGFFINLWPGGFFCCISSLKFLLIFLSWFWRLSSLLFLSLGFVVLGFVPSYVPWLLDSILCAFS